MSVDAVRARKLLGAPELAWLVERLRRRIESGKALGGTVGLSRATAEQRYAVSRLFGRPVTPASSVTVPLDELETIFRDAGICASLHEAVEAVCGHIENRSARRQQQRDDWANVLENADRAHPSGAALTGWLQELRDNGLLRRLARNDVQRGRQLLDQALAVIARLPAAGVPLAELAATAVGDAHALDRGRPVGTLVLSAAEHLGGLDSGSDSDSRRAAWESLGVVCDQLSAPVLVLNLRCTDQSLTGRALNEHAHAGEPYRITARQLLRHAPRWRREGHDCRVFVCENPTVVLAAAERLGPTCAPLVCLDGSPCAAARLLLKSLLESARTLLYHGDFDWGGLRIGNGVMRRFAASPWRYTAKDYQSALHQGGTMLTGRRCTAIWDQELAEAMSAAGVAIHEEQLLDTLLPDLDG